MPYLRPSDTIITGKLSYIGPIHVRYPIPVESHTLQLISSALSHFELIYNFSSSPITKEMSTFTGLSWHFPYTPACSFISQLTILPPPSSLLFYYSATLSSLLLSTMQPLSHTTTQSLLSSKGGARVNARNFTDVYDLPEQFTRKL